MSEFLPAYLGGTSALTTDALVGASEVERSDVFVPGSEELAEGEIRVSILGSGLPWVTKSQAAGSVLIEVGNPQQDVLVFDLGAGSLANFSGLKVPVTSLKNVFLSHLHADHVADYLTLMGSYVKAGRLDPVEVWGGASDDPARGVATFVELIPVPGANLAGASLEIDGKVIGTFPMTDKIRTRSGTHKIHITRRG
ncbi:MAG: hypothetical protein IIC70_12640, partial [Acidobacteria bacterium]|nr:hypothetical protein [Acidobacteriota bacterium]